MKKVMLSFFFLAACAILNAQTPKTVFIELRGGIDGLGNISLDHIETTKKNKAVLDSFVNTTELQREVIRLKEPTTIMSMMVEKGWKFCSSMQVLKDENGRPNSLFIAYYFSKEFNTQTH